MGAILVIGVIASLVMSAASSTDASSTDASCKDDFKSKLSENEIFLWKRDKPEWKEHYTKVADMVKKIFVQDTYEEKYGQISFMLDDKNLKLPVWLFLEEEVGLKVQSITVTVYAAAGKAKYEIRYNPRTVEELLKIADCEKKKVDEHELKPGCTAVWLGAPKEPELKIVKDKQEVSDELVLESLGCSCFDWPEPSEEYKKKRDEFLSEKHGFTLLNT